MEAIRIRCNDPSPAVREAILEMLVRSKGLGSFQLEDNLRLLEEKILDNSLLVRKRCLKIIRDLLIMKVDSEVEARLLSICISQVSSDESSVIDYAQNLLNELWIDLYIGRNDEIPLDSQVSGSFALCIIKIIKYIPDSSTSFKRYLENLLLDSGRKDRVQKLCLGVVDVLFDTLVTAIEKTNFPIVTHVLSALIIFASHDYSYLEQHLRLLMQLVSLNVDAEMVDKSLHLLSLGIKNGSRSAIATVSDIPNEIMPKILRGSEKFVKTGLSVLYYFAKQYSNDFTNLTSLWDRLKAFLMKKLSEIELENQSLSKDVLAPIGRAIYSLGCLSYYSCLDGLSEEQASAVDALKSIFCQYFNRNLHPSISACVIHALGNMTISLPSYFLETEILAVFHEALKSNGSPPVRMAAFSVLYDTLTKDSSFKLDQINFDSVNINDKLDAEPSICSNILQEFIQDIVAATLENSQSESIKMGIRLLEASLLQRLCHPQQIIPTMVALSTSPLEPVRDRAKAVCTTVIYEKFSSFAWSNLASIIQATYRHHRYCVLDGGQVSGYLCSNDETDGIVSVFGAFFNAGKGKKTKRLDFLSSLSIELESSVCFYFDQEKFTFE